MEFLLALTVSSWFDGLFICMDNCCQVILETLLLWHLPDRWIILDLAEIEGFAWMFPA